MNMERRSYRMGARAEGAERTGRRILDATKALFAELSYEALTLQAVAQRAGVTLQTVLRRFGSKEALFAAAARAGRAEVVAQRFEAPAGDIRGVVKNLFDHYEGWGRVAMRMLEQEHRLPAIGTLAQSGRALHAQWVAQALAPQLMEVRGAAARQMRQAQLVALTDVYVWKLLRLDQGLSRRKAEAALVEMIDALCAPGGRS